MIEWGREMWLCAWLMGALLSAINGMNNVSGAGGKFHMIAPPAVAPGLAVNVTLGDGSTPTIVAVAHSILELSFEVEAAP